MYPLSHLYVSSRILGKMNPGLALGSILPDVLVSAGLTWRDAHHTQWGTFQQHLLSPSLSLGASLHGIELPGLDYYSDVSYATNDGYAFQKAREIEIDIIDLGVDAEHALWRGHNFIEMAIEVELNHQYQDLWSYLVEAKYNNALKDQVYQLAISLNASRPKIIDIVLERFLTIRGEKKALAEDYANKLNYIYSLSIESEQCEAIISKSFSAIEADYKSFLSNSILSISQSLRNSQLKY